MLENGVGFIYVRRITRRVGLEVAVEGDQTKKLNNRLGIYTPRRSVLTLIRSVSADHNLFPRLRFGLVSRLALMSQSGRREV